MISLSASSSGFSPLNPCAVCAGDANALKKTEIHFSDWPVPRFRIVAALAIPLVSIVENYFKRHALDFPQLPDVLERLEEHDTIWQYDQCHGEMSKRMSSSLAKFTLTAEDIEKIDGFLFCHLKMDYLGKIGIVRLTDSSLKYGFPLLDLTEDMKRDIFAELSKAFATPIAYSSCQRTGCRDAVFFNVSTALLEHCRKEITSEDISTLTLDLAQTVIQERQDGPGTFASREILYKSVEYLITLSEVNKLAKIFGGTTATSPALSSYQKSRLEVMSWVKSCIAPAPLHPFYVEKIGMILYSASDLDIVSKRITFPSKKEISYRLRMLRGFINLPRKTLRKVTNSLADTTFSYPAQRLDPKLVIHLHLYIRSLLKDLHLEKKIMKKIIELLKQIAI
jgi:hypothetical protein